MGKSLTRSKVLFWILIWVLQILLIGVIVPSNWLVEQVEGERHMTASWLGHETVVEMVENADNKFDVWFQQTRLVERSFALIPTQAQRDRSIGMEDMGAGIWEYVETRIEIMWVTVYQGLQRMAMISLWMPYLLPMLVPAVVQGICAREIKKVSYGYASPVVYHSAGHMMALLLVLPLFYITSPFGVHPAAVLVWGIALSITLLGMISNVQKTI